MVFTLRGYQQRESDIGYNYLMSKEKKPGVIVIPTAGGKSLVIADIVRRLCAPVVIIQPSKELLAQNLAKYESFGGKASIYSASFKQKVISNVTFATIGSIKSKGKEFKEYGVKYVIIDEAHLYPPDDESMFKTFMNDLGCNNVLGLTATPFRLKSYRSPLKENYSQLNMLPRERPAFFTKILDVVQIQEIIQQEYWSPLSYEIHQYDRSSLILNSTGADFTKESIKSTSENTGLWEENIEFQEIASKRPSIGVNNNIYFRLLSLLKKGERNHIIVFLDSVENNHTMVKALNMQFGYEIAACVYAGMPDDERDRIIKAYKKGDIKVGISHSALGTGFDYPEIDCVVFGRPTNSLAIYYQFFGRGTRIPVITVKKDCLLIDACNNFSIFGRLEDLVIEEVEGYGWGVFSGEKLLTGIPMGQVVTKNEVVKGYKGKYHDHSIKKKTEYDDGIIWFGSHEGKKFQDAPKNWVEFIYKTFNWKTLTEERWLSLKKFCEEVLKDG